jgi:hypothetical protein
VLSGLKERPRVGGRGLGGWSETLEGSCLTFTPNTTALHSVPIGRGNLISGFFPFSEIGSGAYCAPPGREGAGGRVDALPLHWDPESQNWDPILILVPPCQPAGMRTGKPTWREPVPVSLKATRELWPSGLWDELPECSGSVHLLETLLHANAC